MGDILYQMHRRGETSYIDDYSAKFLEIHVILFLEGTAIDHFQSLERLD